MRACLTLFLLSFLAADAKDFGGAQFIGFETFESFTKTNDSSNLVLTSPRITTEILWNELVASWNFRSSPEAGLTVEAKAIFPNRETKWCTLAKWALDPTPDYPRESVRDQKDADGTVNTDTLKLMEHSNAVRFRVTLHGNTNLANLSFLGVSFCDSSTQRTALPPNKSAWGKVLAIRERSQASYPEGINEWCSPTSLSMVLNFWATSLNRFDLDYDVPEIARGVNDPNWPGTGNWPFNTAFAGAHKGIRSYVARFGDVSELEDWIEAGIPVAISVAYGYLKGQSERANGHLVVCIGFDETGNIIVNDPGRGQVRQIYSRDHLIRAWAESGNTVYLVYPEKWKLPPDRFGHWFSP